MRIDTTLSSEEERVLRILVEIREDGGDVADYVFDLADRDISDRDANCELSTIKDLGELGYVRFAEIGNSTEIGDLTSLGRCYFADKEKREAEARAELRQERRFRIFLVVLAAAMSIVSGVFSSVLTSHVSSWERTGSQSISSQETDSLTLDPS
ncbi:hypothetical protein ACTQZK_06525 [Paraeggerthella sp. LCP19S3_G8]|uniref:hypothetical protein n=1 Tax=Paraeggerthella sp. LCP19S3_G8 TaxID=3440248 RepID=UPI002A88372E|nr:hypothetical protein [Paraeggerthella sp.]